MKKLIKLEFPKNLAAHFAKYTGENGIVVQLSYFVDGMLTDGVIHAFVIVPEGDVLTAFQNEFKNHIKA